MKSKNILWIVLGAVVCGTLLAATSAGAYTAQTTTIYADKDAYVSSGSKTSNYGTLSYFYAGNLSTTTGYTAYFHFPYSPAPDYLQSANIEISYYDVTSSFFADVYHVSVDSWVETSINWNNQPYGGLYELDSFNVYDTGYTQKITINVESYISDYNGVSICVNSTGYSTSYMTGWSRESSSYRPVLKYTYLVSSFRGIPGYDVMLLVVSSLGTVALLSYKYRTRRPE